MTKEYEDVVKVFKTSYDKFSMIGILIILALLVILELSGWLTGSILIMIVGAVLCIPLLILQLMLILRTRYIITNVYLIIVSLGSKDEFIPLSDILHAKKVKSTISAKAPSSERIELTLSPKRKVYISPKDRDGFLDAIDHKKV